MLTPAILVLPLLVACQVADPMPRPVDPPSSSGALAPNLARCRDGVLLSWLEPVPDGDGKAGERRHRLRVARFSGGRWSEPATAVESGSMFANWADVPAVLDTGDGTLIASWLRMSGEGTYAYDVALTRSADRGKTWAPLGSPHHDGTQTEHGFVSLLPEGEGARAFWLDGREMAASDDGHGGGGHGHGAGDMTLRTAIVHPAMGESRVLDDRVCECCPTSAAVTARGPVVVYRDRSAEEVRDIFIVRRVEGRWTEPKALHADGWTIAGCPVNGPAIDARGDDVVVAWFTAPSTKALVLAAFSSDGGERFGPPVTVDGEANAGRADVVLLESGEAVVSWLDARGAQGALTVRRVAPGGGVGEPLVVAEASLSRAAGVPKMARRGDDLLVVWTETGATTRLRAALVPVASVPAVGRP